MVRTLSILCLAIMLSSGCAAQGPPGKPITAPSERLAFRGFSLLPPQGEDWYIQHQDASGIAFAKVLTAKSKRASQKPTTFIAIAGVIYLKEGPVSDLRAYVEHHIRSEGRFTVRHLQITPDNSLGVECERFESASEERSNPLARGVVFISTGNGVQCRHPFSSRLLFHFSYSERYSEKEPARMDDALRDEAEGVLRSVKFVPFPHADLPGDAHVTSPGASIPRDRAAFSGKWSGTWDNGIEHTLVVEEVRARDASVIFAVGLLSGSPWQRMKASFRQGALVIVSPQGRTVTYRLQPDGSLLATTTGRGETLKATLTRARD